LTGAHHFDIKELGAAADRLKKSREICKTFRRCVRPVHDSPRNAMTTEGRELEERRSGPEEPAAAAVPAIYLIEREAIRLRRMRWTQMAAAVQPEVQPEVQSTLLETYARPRSDAEYSAAAGRTFGAKVKRFFGFRGRGRP
jgi:hypothetical protein